MGIFSSKSLECMLEESTACSARSPEHLKTLSLDPRSPSDEIARTPILVEQTPSSDKFRDVSLESSSESSSGKFQRTPLGVVNNKSNKRSSISQRILSKFSQQRAASKEDSEKCDSENDAPGLPNFELHAENFSDSLVESSDNLVKNVGKINRI